MAEVAVQAGPGSLARMRGRGEVDTSSQFESVRQAVDRFGGGALSPWRQTQAPPPLQLRPEVSQPLSSALRSKPPTLPPTSIIHTTGDATAFAFAFAQVVATLWPSHPLSQCYHISLFLNKFRTVPLFAFLRPSASRSPSRPCADHRPSERRMTPCFPSVSGAVSAAVAANSRETAAAKILCFLFRRVVAAGRP
jgi:hypothetical protein